MELTTFSQFAVIIGLAALCGIIATRFKQPAIIGYIIAGLIISVVNIVQVDSEQLHFFSEMGVTLLLFVLGLELNIGELKRHGKVALILGSLQFVISAAIGFVVVRALGFDESSSLFIAAGLTFSSTIVVVKLLSNSNKLDTLHGRIAIGLLLVQDIIAIIMVVGFGAVSNTTTIGGDLSVKLLTAFTTAIILGVAVFVFVKLILNPLLNSIRNEKEILFVTVIAWALLLAGISKQVGFSVEIGGLIAGIVLSNRFEYLQIESWTKPLRDFFLMLFFVVLGLEIDVNVISKVLFPAIVISLFVLISKPLIILIILKFLNYSKKTAFYTAVSIAQISEFSLILAQIGKVSSEILTLLILATGITWAVSSYLIRYDHKLFELFEKLLTPFKFNRDEDELIKVEAPEIILFGCHRMGESLLNSFTEKKDKILIVDIEPNTVKLLKDKGYNAIFADISDSKLHEAFLLETAKIIVSTVPSLKENLRLLLHIKSLEVKPITIFSGGDKNMMDSLYKHGADFVIYNHFLGGELLVKIVKKGSLSKEVVAMRSKQLEVKSDTQGQLK